jgi:Tol biopolymer transport system component
MRRFLPVALLFALCIVLLVGCDVPSPPPELPTATPGSQNPESLASNPRSTQVPLTPERGFTPLAAPPGHIYFVRASGSWSVSPDGSGESRLSDLPPSNPPVPSPDGSLVAFTSGNGLYVIPSSGGAPSKLAEAALPENQRLGWAPDGSIVGYISEDTAAPGRENAWTVPVKAGSSTLLTTLEQGAPGRGPAYERSVLWSPDGKWVTVAGLNNPMRLLRWPLSTSRADDMRDIPGGEPDWSPDSRTIVYAETLNGALSIYYVVAAGATPFRNEQQLVGTRLGEYAQGPGPRWSPASSGSDSDLIAYRSRSPDGEPRVSIRQRWGKELAPLPGPSNNPSWSPSGDRLVVETGYVKAGTFGEKWTPDGLAIAGISLSGQHSVTSLVKDGWWPAWGK